MARPPGEVTLKVKMQPELVLPLREAEALRVGPDDVLIVHLPATTDEDDGQLDAWKTALEQIGLGHRSLIVRGPVQFTLADIPANEGDPT